MKIEFAPNNDFPCDIQIIPNNKGITPDSPNWENDFLAELVRENCVELGEIECAPIALGN